MSWGADAGGVAEIRVHVQPGARRSGVVGVHGDALKVAVKEKALAGAANRAVVELLGAALGVAPSRVRIVSGARSRKKRVRIDGMGLPDAKARIGLLLRD